MLSQGLDACVHQGILPFCAGLRLEFQDQDAVPGFLALGQVFVQRRDGFPVFQRLGADIREGALLDVDATDASVMVHDDGAVGREVQVELAAPAAELLGLPEGGDGVLGIVVPPAAVGDDAGVGNPPGHIGLYVLPVIVWPLDGLEGGNGGLPFVVEELDQDPVGFPAPVEDHLQVGGEGAVPGGEPVRGRLLDGKLLAHAFQSQVGNQAQERPVVAEREVCRPLHLAGDDIVGLPDQNVHEGLVERDAQLSVQLGIGLVQVGGEEVVLMEADDVFEGQVAEQVVVDVEGFGHPGRGVDGPLEAAQVRNQLPAGRRVREEVLQDGHGVQGGGVLPPLGEGLPRPCADGFVLPLGNVFHVGFARVQVQLQVGLDGGEPGGETVHGHDAAGNRAGDGPDVLAAVLEYLRIAVVHPVCERGMLPDAAGREPAVHPVVGLEDAGGLVHQRITGRGEDALLCPFRQDVPYEGVLVSAPFGTGAVPAVMADVEGFVTLGSRRVVQRQEFVGMRVERRPAGVLPEVPHDRRVRLGKGRDGEKRRGDKGQESFHAFQCFSKCSDYRGGLQKFLLTLRILKRYRNYGKS